MNHSLQNESENPQNKLNSLEAQDEHEKLVNAKTLLLLLWDAPSRPSLRWLREQQARRTLPYVKLGARVWFLPSAVRRCLQDKWIVKRR